MWITPGHTYRATRTQPHQLELVRRGDCRAYLYLFDGVDTYDGHCILPHRHEPPNYHFDGRYWFDDQRHLLTVDVVPSALVGVAECRAWETSHPPDPPPPTTECGVIV